MGVPVVGGGVHDDVHIGASDDFAVIFVAVGRFKFGALHGAVEVFGVDVAEGGDLDAFIGEEVAEVAVALSAEADAGEVDSGVWGDGTSSAEDGGGEQEREGGFEELAAGWECGGGWHGVWLWHGES